MRLVFGNFKMNLDSSEIDNYIDFFKGKELPNVVFAPSAIYLERFVKNGFKVASQDVGFKDKGAYTGDISAIALKSIGVSYAIVGHSERRKYYDDNRYVNEKVKLLLNEGLFPIICIGETKEEHDNGKTFDILAEEINEALKNIDTNSLNNVIIAYEPIFSIGTGVIPTNLEIEKTITFIKNYFKEHFSISLRVLYGGSVNVDSISNLESIPNIDGYLVGGCSIKCEEFDKLIKNVG